MHQKHLPALGARYWMALCLASIFGANIAVSTLVTGVLFIALLAVWNEPAAPKLAHAD
jgi:hypothetical protein